MWPLPFAVMPPIASALREAMTIRGITVADLARDLDWPAPSLYNIHSGRVHVIRERHLRDALDDYLGAPTGTTLAICEGKLPGYPNDRLLELYRLGADLPPGALDHLVGLLRAVGSAN